MIFLVLLSIFLHQASSSPVNQPLSFSFSSFSQLSCSSGSLICTGAVTPYNGYLSLTSEPFQSNSSYYSATLPLNEVGRVLYKQPVIAWPAMISTTFTIRISRYPNTTDSADGMTFVFAPDSNPSPPNSYGSSLGIFSRSQGKNCACLYIRWDLRTTIIRRSTHPFSLLKSIWSFCCWLIRFCFCTQIIIYFTH